MTSPLLIIRDSVKRTFRQLIDLDGMTPDMLGDLLGYDGADMAYKITNEHTDTLPPLDRFLYASQRMSGFGNTRLGMLAFGSAWVARRMVSALTNGCFRDEYHDLNRAALSIEDSCDASDFDRAERHLDELDAVVARYRAELARRKGEQTMHRP